VIEMLDRFLEQPRRRNWRCGVGLEGAHPASRASRSSDDREAGQRLPAKVAVLGPMRMHYERVSWRPCPHQQGAPKTPQL